MSLEVIPRTTQADALMRGWSHDPKVCGDDVRMYSDACACVTCYGSVSEGWCVYLFLFRFTGSTQSLSVHVRSGKLKGLRAEETGCFNSSAQMSRVWISQASSVCSVLYTSGSRWSRWRQFAVGVRANHGYIYSYVTFKPPMIKAAKATATVQ